MEGGEQQDSDGFKPVSSLFLTFYIQSVSPPPPSLSSMTRFKVHLLPPPTASLTPEQPPTELLTQGKLDNKVCGRSCV